MSARDRIAKLESLLDRIRRNAKKPRAAGRPPVESVSVTAVESDVSVEVIEDLDLDDDIVEIAPAELEITEVAAESDMEIEFEEEEVAPESAPRPSSLGEAITAKADEAALEGPPITPPPESGRQEVTGEPGAAGAQLEAELEGIGAVDELLEADLSGAPISAPKPGVPTMEQLGETVDLEGEEAPTDQIELHEAPTVSRAKAPSSHELEVSLPKNEFAGGYKEGLAPPPEAREELARHRSPAVAPTASPTAASSEAPSTKPAQVAERRPAPARAEPAEMVVEPREPEPRTFKELLEATLAL